MFFGPLTGFQAGTGDLLANISPDTAVYKPYS